MIKHALREGLATSLCAEVSIETKRFHDWKVSFDIEHWSSRPLFCTRELSAAFIQYSVNAPNGVLRALDFRYMGESLN